MKKLIVFLFLSFFTMPFLTIGCGEKYSDVKKTNEEFIAIMEDYIADLEKADNEKDAAKAINRFADGMEELFPSMQKLSEKYPELKDKSNLPEELKESQQRVEEVSKKMVGGMMKMMAYMNDPEVQKAQQRLGAVMTK